MKKAFACLLAFILCAMILVSCGNVEEDTSYDLGFETVSKEISFENESRFIPDGNTSEESNDVTTETGSFIIKDKKYYYFFDGKDTDVLIMDVKNDTANNYSVTVRVKFFDEKGSVLNSQSQTFKEFRSGYQMYFMFRPYMVFDSYEYTIETENYDGPCPLCDLEPKFEGFSIGWWKAGPGSQVYASLDVDLSIKNNSDTTILPSAIFVVFFNKDGEIVWIGQGGTGLVPPGGTDDATAYQCFPEEGHYPEPIYIFKDQKLSFPPKPSPELIEQIPDYLKEELSAIFMTPWAMDDPNDF